MLHLTFADDLDYYLLVDRALSVGGEDLVAPFELHLSTRPSMGVRSVQGQVARLDGGSPVGVVVALFDASPFGEDETSLLNCAVVLDPAGSMAIPYVRPGLYFPVAAYDLNGDGNINPEEGDRFGFLDSNEDGLPDSIIVAEEDLDGINILLFGMGWTTAAERLSEAHDLAESYAQVDDAELMVVMGMGDINDEGESIGWFYQFRSESLGNWIHVGFSGPIPWVEVGPADWPPMSSLPENMVDSDVAMGVALANGGWGVEEGLVDGERSAMLGKFSWMWPEDPDLPLWAIFFLGWNDAWEYEERVFLLDAVTGQFLTTFETPVPESAVRPQTPVLGNPWPNPFNPVTHIPVDLPAPRRVTLTAHNLVGQLVARLVDGPLPAGHHELLLDGTAWPAACTCAWSRAVRSRHASCC